MATRLWLVAAVVIGLAAPVQADRRSDAKAHVDFGIKIAQKGLWKEATMHWERAVAIDEKYAAAWNNLGVGYEQLGKFEEARKAYDMALRLDGDNTFIQNNYDQFREIYDRQKKRTRR